MEVAEKPKTSITDLTYEQLASVRNKINLEIKRLDDSVKELKEKRDKVDVEFLRRFNAEGISSVKTRLGTPHVLTQTSVSIGDREAFWNWMQENNALDFMNYTANKSMVAAYLEDHEKLPPGINWYAEKKIGFKKS